LAIRVGEDNVCELLAESFLHVGSSLNGQYLSVKAALSFFLSERLVAAQFPIGSFIGHVY
jgi:hypothetical protein